MQKIPELGLIATIIRFEAVFDGLWRFMKGYFVFILAKELFYHPLHLFAVTPTREIRKANGTKLWIVWI